jgi:hypothetical protein
MKAIVRTAATGRSRLGDSASDELLGAAEIRTPAFRRSTRAREIVPAVAATSAPAGWGSARASTRTRKCAATGWHADPDDCFLAKRSPTGATRRAVPRPSPHESDSAGVEASSPAKRAQANRCPGARDAQSATSDRPAGSPPSTQFCNAEVRQQGGLTRVLDVPRFSGHSFSRRPARPLTLLY